MFRSIILLTAISAALLRAEDAKLPDAQRLDVFLLIGQSNMAGRGKPEAEDQTPDPRVWVFNKAREWALAVDPLHFDKPKIAGVGLGLTFGKTLAARDKNKFIGLVPSAFGGTSIDEWKKGGKLYEDAIARARAALKHGRLAGMLWHQGEADAKPEKREVYGGKLAQLVQDFREDLKAPDAPFVAGQLGEFHAGTTAFNEMVMELPKRIPQMAAVPSKDLTSIGDNTHFDSKSQREFGRRYAEAFLKLAK